LSDDLLYSKKIQHFIAFSILLLLGLYLQWPYLSDFPSHIHAWAQADRYAIALGFTKNGFNLFAPETMIYNHQFPSNWTQTGTSSITSVDFPIHEYLIALIMKITGNYSPLIFRSYTLVYSVIGLFFLYKTAYRLSQSFPRALFVALFAATSPLFVYYQGGFLPSIPSLANCFIGLYYFVDYLQNRKNASFNISLLFFTLAALNRTTLVIPLLAAAGLVFIQILQGKSKILPKIIPYLLAFSAMLGYLLYNNFLRAQYGSDFLNILLPAESFQEYKEMFWNVKAKWKYTYFSWWQYETFALVFAGSLLFILLRFKKLISDKLLFPIMLFGFIALVGCMAFSVAMTKQFDHHDYYFLDTFYFPFMVFLMAGLSILPQVKNSIGKIGSSIIVALLLIPFVADAAHSQKERRKPELWELTHLIVHNLKAAPELFAKNNVTEDAKILFLGSGLPNLPFVLMQRKGYAVMEPSENNIETALTWDYDYVLFQTEFFATEVYPNYPQLLEMMERIAATEKIILCKKKEQKITQTLADFLGLDQLDSKLIDSLKLQGEANLFWDNPNQQALIDNENNALNYQYVDENTEFGATWRMKGEQLKNLQGQRLYFSGQFNMQTLTDCEIVVSLKVDDDLVFYRRNNLFPIIKKPNTWQAVQMLFDFPIVNTENAELSLYIWNTGKSFTKYHDLSVEIYALE